VYSVWEGYDSTAILYVRNVRKGTALYGAIIIRVFHMKLQIEKIKISNTLLTMTGLFVISLVAFAANVASAQERTGDTQERVEDARENVTERVQSVQENVAERTASATEALRSRASTTRGDLEVQSESRREAIQERLIEQRTALRTCLIAWTQ